jgi:hypothetical protein
LLFARSFKPHADKEQHAHFAPFGTWVPSQKRQA